MKTLQDMPISLLLSFIFSTFYLTYNVNATPGLVEELKSNSGDVSLSINIPSLALSDVIKGDARRTGIEARENIKGSNETSNEKEDKSESKGSKSLDLARLLSSGNAVSIKSTETNTMGERGNTEKSVKEIAIDTLGTQESKANNKEGGQQMDDKTVAKIVSALKNGIFNSSDQKGEQMNVNPSTALSKLNSASEPSKDLKELKGKDKNVEAAAESKPADGSQASKSNGVQPNQIALVPVSLPSSLLTQLQNAMGGGNNSANSGNGTSMVFPNLATLLSHQNVNTNSSTAYSGKNDTNAITPQNAFNESASFSNSSKDENESQEGAKANRKKENEGDKMMENKAVSKNNDANSKEGESLTTESKPRKDSPILVVIPQITSPTKDISEGKSGFFSKTIMYPMRSASSKVT